MSGQQPPKPPVRMPGSIDFELTNFDEARHMLDDLPAGLAESRQLLSGSWEEQRRKPLATDRALTGEAMDWVIGLPPTLRPHSTCEQFPRVANVIASSWVDSTYAVQVLDHLIKNYRGGRRGFPAAVKVELEALHAHLLARSGR